MMPFSVINFYQTNLYRLQYDKYNTTTNENNVMSIYELLRGDVL